MSQAKVNDFFCSKKKTEDVNPSKRRKIDPTIRPSARSSRSSSLLLSNKDQNINIALNSPAINAFSSDSTELFKFNASKSEPLNMPLQQQKGKAKSTTVRKTTKRNKGLVLEKSQMKLTDLMSPITKTDSESVIETFEASGSSEPEQQSELTLTEEITSIADDHDFSKNGLCTPRKRLMTIDPDSSIVPKTRTKKLAPRRLSDENKERLVKKNQELSLSFSESNGGALLQQQAENTPQKDVFAVPVSSEQAEDKNVKLIKSELLALVSSVVSPPTALSPLPQTPNRSPAEAFPSPSSPKQMSPKLQNLSQKLKNLSKMNKHEKAALKNRLKQSGKLDDMKLKEKLADLSSALVHSKELQPVKTAEPVVESKSDEKEKSLPAHQRFEHLTTEGVPTLALPFSYRLLDQAFHAMDTVVSMMHNRSEICTYSKLKAACQNMTRKNFEEKAVGQIKTITPDAYSLRQEKNVPAYGQKVHGYQLTIEPKLNITAAEAKSHTKEGKPVFTASMLLKRKQDFKRNLLDQVMQHHKEFLSTLSPPIKISSDKLTRWHPKFPLDKLPEVPTSPLPIPPEVYVYHSARDVLDKQRGKLNPRVEEALKNVADANTAAEAKASSPSTPKDTSSSCGSPSNSPSLKGVPPALLAKIRAKEAAKMASALTRDPAEDTKTKMLGHLPEMMRIIRGYFITEKKPALPVEVVYKKLQDSSRNGISMRDVEAHIALLKEVAPELVTVVEIKRGKFIKLDRNVDIQTVAGRIMNQVKARA